MVYVEMFPFLALGVEIDCFVEYFSWEHLTSDMEIIRLFHVVLIAHWGITTLLEVLTPRLDFLFVIPVSMDYGAIDTLGLVFSTYLDDLRYLHTFHFILRHFTLDTFMPSILPELDHYFLLSYTSHPDI